MELIRYAEAECQAWFTANDAPTALISKQAQTSQAIRYENIFSVDGSWTCTSVFSGFGWMWQDNTRLTQLMYTRYQWRRETALHTELEAHTRQWKICCIIQHVNIFGRTAKV